VKATTICGCRSSEPCPSRNVSRDDREGDQADRARTLTCVPDDSTSIAVVAAHHAAIRSSSHSSMKAENWFQLRIVGVGQRSLSRATHPSVEGWNRSGFSRGSIGLGEPSRVECGNVNDCAVDGVLRRHRCAVAKYPRKRRESHQCRSRSLGR
jgi:hypothetical protein